jgi:uncharacterized coiled-coil DUF342 family protein
MARNVFVDHSCGYIDDAIDKVETMKDEAAHAKYEVEVLAGHMLEYLNTVDLEENDPEVVDYCIGAFRELYEHVDDLDLSDTASDVEYNMETSRNINSELRNEAENYGIEADNFEAQAESLQDALVRKDEEIRRLEVELGQLEVYKHGQNIKQPQWQPR